MLIPPTIKVSVVLSGGIGGTGPALCRRLGSSIEREERSEVRSSPVLDDWDALSDVSVSSVGRVPYAVHSILYLGGTCEVPVLCSCSTGCRNALW